jgi:hypothetical protein
VLPAEAESIGREHVTATYLGREWRLPLDVDTWPLTLVRRSVVTTGDRKTIVDHVAVAMALEIILGDQWEAFIAVAKRRRDLAPAANAFAAAVGIAATGERSPIGEYFDQAFGGIPRLLAVIDTWPLAVESDLNRFWGIDYRDRWRFTKRGRRRLTLRRIYARISHLPADSALAIAMGRRSPMELLTMDVFEAVAGQAHPARPLTPEQSAERHKAAEAKRKAVEAYEKRREARGVAAGLATARENAKRGEVSGEE